MSIGWQALFDTAGPVGLAIGVALVVVGLILRTVGVHGPHLLGALDHRRVVRAAAEARTKGERTHTLQLLQSLSDHKGGPVAEPARKRQKKPR